MSFRLGSVVFLAAASLVACGDDKGSTSSSSSGGSSGTPTASSSSGGSSSGDTTSGGAADAGAITPKAEGPKLTSIMKMTGGLHVNWELPTECEGVELERKDGDATEFAVKYKLPGTVDNKHDGTATEDVVYTYRARCKVGTEYTEYSNEMGKNPVQ
jgi:hypothetical protein